MKSYRIEDVVQHIMGMRDDFAKSALSRSGDWSLFDCGRANGIYQGLDKVVRELEAIIEARDKQEKAA